LRPNWSGRRYSWHCLRCTRWLPTKSRQSTSEFDLSINAAKDVLSSAKTTLPVKRPPSPVCIRDASRQAQVSSRCGDWQAVRVCDRCPERWPGGLRESRAP
jgi:hypothetical protein